MFVTFSLYTDQQRQQLGSEGQIFKINFKDELSQNKLNWYFSYDYGNCLQFNSGLNRTNNPIPLESLSSEGQQNGLQIKMWI